MESKRILTRLWLVLFAALWLVGCADSDDDDSDAGGGDNDAGDDTNDDDAGDNDDTGGGDDTASDDDDYPDDLDDCAPYYELDPWFDFTEVNEAVAVSEFYEAFGDNFVAGEVVKFGDRYAFRSGDWEVSINWLTEEFDPPFVNGQAVQIYMGPGDVWDETDPWLWVLDEPGQTLLYLAHSLYKSAGTGGHEMSLSSEYACEYRDNQPPESYWGPWLRVFAFAAHGAIDGQSFDVSVWDAEGATADGALLVQLPYAYFGRVDTDQQAYDIDPQHQGEALLQLVRAPVEVSAR